TSGGLLTWKITSGGVKTAPPGDDYASRNPSAKGFESQSIDLGNGVSLLPGGPCLGLDLGAVEVQGCGSITAHFLSGHFDFGGSPAASFDLPTATASATLSEHLSAGATLDLQFSGNVSVEGKILPLFDIDINLENQLKGKVEANIIAGLDLGVGQNTPIEIQPSFDFSEDVSAGIAVGLFDGITFPNSGANESHHASCDVISLGDACAKLRIGPKIELSLNFGGIELGGDAFVDGYVQACLTPTANTSTSISADRVITGGIKAGLDAEANSGDLTIRGQLLGINIVARTQLAVFTFVLKDRGPPVITCPADIVQGTDPGQ